MDKTDNNYRENYLILKGDFKNEDSPVVWARELAKAIDDGRELDTRSEEIEEARRLLLLHIKNGVDQNNWSKEEALEALILCVKYDRANALNVMKISQYDPHCPRGFVWVSEENLNKPDVQKTGMTRCSITSKYRKFAEKFGASDEYKRELNSLLETAYPNWANQVAEEAGH